MVSAVVSEESAVGSSSCGTDVFKLTYLEVGFLFINSVNLDLFWLFRTSGGPVLGPPWQRPENG